MDKSLRTQKDGRLFAIELLKKIEAMSADSPFSCVDDGPGDDDGPPFLFPPQSSMIREAFDQIYAAPEDARAGFFVVMTEELGGRGIGHVNLEAYEKWEAEGRMREMPEARHGND